MSDWESAYGDVEWQKKRDKIRIRDNYTCRFCGTQSRQVHVHHLIYRKGAMPWEYPDDELLCICDQCHEYVTGVINKAKLKLTNSRNIECLCYFADLLTRYKGDDLSELIMHLNLLSSNTNRMPIVMQFLKRLEYREFMAFCRKNGHESSRPAPSKIPQKSELDF